MRTAALRVQLQEKNIALFQRLPLEDYTELPKVPIGRDGGSMDLRFWVRLCACTLFVFSVALLVVSANTLRIYRQSQTDVTTSINLIAGLFNGTSSTETVEIDFETWNQLNMNLYNVKDRWNLQIALSIAGISIVCICFVFEVAILLLPFRVWQKGERLSLLSRPGNKNYQNIASVQGGASARSIPGGDKKGAMMCEGALYEPWNQATLDKLSSEESTPATKITRAIYRYGPIAGKILMRRFGHLLTDVELTEIERILNFGQEAASSFGSTGSIGSIISSPRSPAPR